jgi:uncharacterized membrane protein YqhA
MKKLTNLFVLFGLSLATLLFGYSIGVELVHATIDAIHNGITESDALVLLLTMIDAALVIDLAALVIGNAAAEIKGDAVKDSAYIKEKLSFSLVTISGVNLLKVLTDIASVEVQVVIGAAAIHLVFLITLISVKRLNNAH